MKDEKTIFHIQENPQENQFVIGRLGLDSALYLIASISLSESELTSLIETLDGYPMEIMPGSGILIRKCTFALNEKVVYNFDIHEVEFYAKYNELGYWLKLKNIESIIYELDIQKINPKSTLNMKFDKCAHYNPACKIVKGTTAFGTRYGNEFFYCRTHKKEVPPGDAIG